MEKGLNDFFAGDVSGVESLLMFARSCCCADAEEGSAANKKCCCWIVRRPVKSAYPARIYTAMPMLHVAPTVPAHRCSTRHRVAAQAAAAFVAAAAVFKIVFRIFDGICHLDKEQLKKALKSWVVVWCVRVTI